jgi:hypothetical protein
MGDNVVEEAAFALGQIYYFGNPMTGLQPDYQRARDYFQIAADGGIPDAQANLGLMQLNGLGGTQDNETAIVSLQEAAKRGNGAALNGLGAIYFSGIGVAANITASLEYFEQATTHGFPTAHGNLGEIYLQGHGIPQNLTKALYHLELAEKARVPMAYYYLGWMYMTGRGVVRNCTEAVNRFKIVTEKGMWMQSLPYSMERSFELQHTEKTSTELHLGNAEHTETTTLLQLLQYLVLGSHGVVPAMMNAAFILEGDAGHPEVEELLSLLKELGGGEAAPSPPSSSSSSSCMLEDECPTEENGQGLTSPSHQQAFALQLYAASQHDRWGGEGGRKLGDCHLQLLSRRYEFDPPP